MELREEIIRRVQSINDIMGGCHRWKIAKDLGYETVPCAVVELDDRRAKILSVNLNEMKAQSVSVLLSELIHDLTQVLSLEDLGSIQPSKSTTVATAPRSRG